MANTGRLSFASDYMEGAHPLILQRLMETNLEKSAGYGLDASQIAEAAGYNASASGAFPQEIILVKAVDSDAAASVAQAFTDRLSNIASQAESYDPDSLALAQKCQVVTNGDYVGLFFSDHYDQLVELFQNGLNG